MFSLMNWWQVIVLASRKRKPLQEEKHYLFMELDVGDLFQSGVYFEYENFTLNKRFEGVLK